jgi:hypothetical protein
MEWANSAPQLRTNAPGTQARLHTGPGGDYLYVVNPDRAPRRIGVTLPSAWAAGEDVWGGQKVVVNGKAIAVTVGDRDAAIIHLSR